MGHGNAYGRFYKCGEVLFVDGKVAARCTQRTQTPHAHDGEVDDLIAHGLAIRAWEETCEVCELPFVRSHGKPYACPECLRERRRERRVA